MSVLFEDEVEAVRSRIEAVGLGPLSQRAEEIPPIVQKLEAFLSSSKIARLRQLSSPERAALMPKFQQLVDLLREQVNVGDQVRRFGEAAPWAQGLAEVTARLEAQLRRRGFALRASPPSPWRVNRHPISGELFVSKAPAADTDPAAPPQLEDTLRSLIATAERTTHVPDVKLAAQMLDQNIEHLRSLAAQERTIASLRGEPSTRADALAQVLREAEDALERLTLVLEADAARVALAEPGESIPFEQLQRELGL